MRRIDAVGYANPNLAALATNLFIFGLIAVISIKGLHQTEYLIKKSIFRSGQTSGIIRAFRRTYLL
jgi:hypothetical protein